MSVSRDEARERHPRHQRRGEVRLPAAVATLIAIVLYLALPQQLLIGPRYILPSLWNSCCSCRSLRSIPGD
jgi:hypothetical protein